MKISVVIPTYNEQDNIIPLVDAISTTITTELPQYDYEILFIDNDSRDDTRKLLREVTGKNSHVKAIFNLRNFGQHNSPYYGMMQSDGDCTILMCADFQDPIEMIPKLVHEWENGYPVVCAIKTASKENSFIYFLRNCYYKLIKAFSEVDQIENFTGFGLYDRSFIEIMKRLDDSKPFLRGIVAEYAPNRKEIEYCQNKRKYGKSKNNFFSLYDTAMLSFTSYTKITLRLATFLGFMVGICSFIIGLVYLVLKLIYWDGFAAGVAPILISTFFLGAVQLSFIGLIGEYILSINQRLIKRPIVIEKERLNFEKENRE